MRYLYAVIIVLLFACNTSSTEKRRENDSTKVDGTRMSDTLMASDSVPPGVQNPQPD